LWDLIVCNSAVARVSGYSWFDWFDRALEQLFFRENRLYVHNIIVIEIWGLASRCLAISSFQRWRLAHKANLLNAGNILVYHDSLIWCCTTFSIKTSSIKAFLINFCMMNFFLHNNVQHVNFTGNLYKRLLNNLSLTKDSRWRFLKSLDWLLFSFCLRSSSLVCLFHWFLYELS